VKDESTILLYAAPARTQLVCSHEREGNFLTINNRNLMNRKK